MQDKWAVSFCKFLVLCVLGVSVLLSGGRLFAQVDTGTILGTVKDSSGAVVPEAQVTLTNPDTGFTLNTKTSNTGTYIFTPIKIGTYTVQATLAGFQKAVQLNAKVDVEQRLVVDLTLVPGQVTQTVEVTAAPPVLQTQNAMVGQVVGHEAVDDLPLNGRNFTFLAQTVAGVHMSGFWSGGFGGAGSFSANGTRPEQNNYLLDGMDNNTNQLDFLAGTNYVNLPPPDAIGEFKLQTADYSADVGKGGGAILNGTIRSGTNQLHGDVWEFVRNDKFDAANFFENSPTPIKKGEYRLNQFGGTIGGPVVIPHVYDGRNKTFFFADYQGTRLRQGQTHVNSVPTAAEASSGFTNLLDIINGETNAACLGNGSCTRTDDLGRIFPNGTVLDPATTRPVTQGAVDPVTNLVAASSGFVRDPFYTGSLIGMTNFTSSAIISQLNQLPAGRLDPNAIKLLQLYPAPTGPGIVNNETVNPPLTSRTDQNDDRVDHVFGDKDQMFARASWSVNPMYNPPPFTGYADDGALAIAGGGHQWNPTLNTVLSETHSFSPTVINEIRAGVTRQSTTAIQAYADTMGIPAQFGIQGIPQRNRNGGLPSLGIGGLTQIGSTAWFPSEEPNQTDQLMENVTFLKGRHTFKAGLEIQHIKWAVLQPSWPRGQFNFGGGYTEVPYNGTGTTGMAQMLLGAAPTTVAGGVQSGGSDGVFASNIFNRDFTHNYYAGYFQDDWKVTPKLTLNLGLRWEFFDMGVDDFSNESAFQFHSFAPNGGGVYKIANKWCNAGLVSPAFVAALHNDNFSGPECVNPAGGFISVPKTDFGPRFGLAYRISNKLVMRGGYGLYYGPPEQPLDHEDETYPFDNTLSWFGDGVHSLTYGGGQLATLENGMLYAPVYNTGSFNANQVAALDPNGDDPNFKPTYTESYNLTFQYQLTPNNTISLGYVGNQAHDLTVQPNINGTVTVLPPSYNANPGGNGAQYRPMPDFVNNSMTYSEGSSFYHSLQATFERRLSNGLYFNANYTYSELFTDGQSINNGSSPYRAPIIPGLGIQYDYSRSQYDIPQLFHFSGGYELPMGKGHSFLGNAGGVANQLVSGWKTNFILTLQDGYPFNIGTSTSTHGSNDGLNSNADLVPGQNIDAGPHNVNQWINPKAFVNPAPATAIGQTAALGGMGMQARGPGFHRLDFSIFKDFRTSERTHLQFRAEIFNLTNTPQFANPSNTSIGSVYFGQITGLVDGANDPREIQFALKLYF
jgi:hypothetical protein